MIEEFLELFKKITGLEFGIIDSIDRDAGTCMVLADNVTPQQTKIGMTGNKNATKEQIMDAAIEYVNGDTKIIENKRTKKMEKHYHLIGVGYRYDVFEHIN